MLIWNIRNRKHFQNEVINYWLTRFRQVVFVLIEIHEGIDGADIIHGGDGDHLLPVDIPGEISEPNYWIKKGILEIVRAHICLFPLGSNISM